MILGGEVDCVKEGAGIHEGLDTSDFIELKTNLVIDSAKDEQNFERWVRFIRAALLFCMFCAWIDILFAP